MAHFVGELAERIGAGRIDHIHGNQHRGSPGQSQAALLCSQHQKRLAETRQGEHGANSHHPPVGRAEPRQIGPADRIRASRAGRALRFAHPNNQQHHAQKRRNRGKPEHRAEIIGPQKHEPHGEQGPDEGADGVQ